MNMSRPKHPARRGSAAAPPAPHPAISRLKPPPLASASIKRKKLLAKIDRALEKQLVLVVAPIGSGKTTLLTQWYEHVAAARAVAWLSLDELDNEPVRFLSCLAAAVRSAVEDFGGYVANRLHDRAHPPLEHMSELFVESLGSIERDVAVVLDDFQWIADAAVTRAFLYVLRRSPANVRWIVSSRRLPELDLSRFKLEDRLALLGGAELNFDGAHIVQLSRLLCGSGLSAEDADGILARTEGWVAGVKLALLSAGDPAHARESLNQFTGSHSEVAGYLAEAVLRDQPAAVREFLVMSSIADRLNGDLCDALLGSGNGAAMLESLEQSQLFIQPLDSQRQWYRYHVLFRDFLRARLQRDFPDRVAPLHRAASAWFIEHRMEEDALTHAFACGDRAWCVELTARCVQRWFYCGEIVEVQRWTARLLPNEILDHPGIVGPYVVSLILSRRFAHAAALLRDIEGRAAGRKPAVPLKLMNLMLAILSDTNDDPHAADDGPIAVYSDDAFLNGTLLAVHAYRFLQRQQFDAARRLGMRARDALREIDNVYASGYADLVVCLADRAQGRMKAAADNCEQLYARVNDRPRTPAWVNAATALAHLRYEQNRLAESEALCIEALPLLSIASTVENVATAYATLARLKSIRGRPSEAFQLLDYLHSVLESDGQRRFLAHVCYEKIRLCLLQPDLERAHAVAADFGLPGLAADGEWRTARAYDEPWERLGFAWAALLMHERRYDECRGVLEALRESACRIGYVYRQVPLEAALAACDWSTGRHEAAFEALNRALGLTRMFGFTRSAFDEVPALRELVAAAMKARKLQRLPPTKYLRRFGNIFTADPAAGRSRGSGCGAALPLEPLTGRELEMLRLLSRGFSNQEISARSQIALSTAKWHLKNVFAKLDVGTRTGAIARARELQLID